MQDFAYIWGDNQVLLSATSLIEEIIVRKDRGSN